MQRIASDKLSRREPEAAARRKKGWLAEGDEFGRVWRK